MWSAGAYRCLYIYTYYFCMYLVFRNYVSWVVSKRLATWSTTKCIFLCGCLTTRVDMASVRIVAALIKKNNSCLGSVGLEAFESQSHAAAGRVLWLYLTKLSRASWRPKRRRGPPKILRNALMSLGDPKFLEGLGPWRFRGSETCWEASFFKWGHYLSLLWEMSLMAKMFNKISA